MPKGMGYGKKMKAPRKSSGKKGGNALQKLRAQKAKTRKK